MTALLCISNPHTAQNVQVGFCGFLILTIVGNGFQTCGELFQAGRAHLDCSCLSLPLPLSFLFFFFFFFLPPFCKPSERCSLKFPSHLAPAAGEQSRTVPSLLRQAPSSNLVGAHQEGRAGSPRLVAAFPPHHCPHSRVAWKLKHPKSM